MSKREFYVYVIRDPRPGERNVPRYVGKGIGNRSTTWLRNPEKKTNAQMRKFLIECKRLGLVPSIKRVAHFKLEESSSMREIELIEQYGRVDLGTGTLFNETRGGDGIVGCIATAVSARRRMKQYNKDPLFREAYLKGLAKLYADKAYMQWFKRRCSAVNRKRWENPVYYQKHVKRLIKLGKDPILNEMRSRLGKERWSDPESGRVLIAELIKRNKSKKMRESSRQVMIKVNANPEFKLWASQHMTRVNADPSMQAKQLAGYNKIKKALGKRNSKRMHLRNLDPDFQAKCQAGRAASRAAKLAAQVNTD
jgi:hypothetical protein